MHDRHAAQTGIKARRFNGSRNLPHYKYMQPESAFEVLLNSGDIFGAKAEYQMFFPMRWLSGNAAFTLTAW